MEQQCNKEGKVYNISIRKKTVFTLFLSDGLGWFRILGKGLHWKDTTKHSLIFSDRYYIGWPKINIGKWIIKILN